MGLVKERRERGVEANAMALLPYRWLLNIIMLVGSRAVSWARVLQNADEAVSPAQGTYKS